MRRLLISIVLLCLLHTPAVFAQWERYTNLPTIYIETFDGVPITSKENYIYCTLRYIDEEDQVTVYDSVQIRGRGNSTWGMAKKPYRIKFKEKEKFLGKGYAKAKSWTLLANAADKTLIRNAVTSALGEFTSLPFNPAYKFVDLVLNGRFLGNYQISDQVQVRPHRVDITEQDYPSERESNITGGYLLEVDGFKDGNCFTTVNYGVPVRVHYPDEDEITVRQNIYIRNYIDSFEKALKGSKFDDPDAGYRAYVDSATLFDWYLCTEISANIDGFYSTYFYKDQDDPLLYWGPLWDYDIAYSNDYRIQGTVNALMTDVGYGKTKDWVRRMWQDKWFAKNVYKRYKNLLDNGLVNYLFATIDSLDNLLQESQELNYEQWGISRRMYHEIVLYSSYEEYITYLRSFISAHCDFLEKTFANTTPIEPTPPFATTNYFYRILNAGTSMAVDGAGGTIQQYSNEAERNSEDWWIKEVDGHFMLINRQTLEALCDPTEGAVGPTENIGTRLTTAEEDPNDDRQKWDIVPQGTEGYYNLVNVHSQHAANLSGGNSANGTPIISYTNDGRNASSMNRLWYLLQTREEIPETLTGISVVEPNDYALAYNPVTDELHFGSATPELLQRFTASVYTSSGMCIGTFRADERFSMSSYPHGIYIVSWQMGNTHRSTKFKR